MTQSLSQSEKKCHQWIYKLTKKNYCSICKTVSWVPKNLYKCKLCGSKSHKKCLDNAGSCLGLKAQKKETHKKRSITAPKSVVKQPDPEPKRVTFPSEPEDVNNKSLINQHQQESYVPPHSPVSDRVQRVNVFINLTQRSQSTTTLISGNDSMNDGNSPFPSWQRGLVKDVEHKGSIRNLLSPRVDQIQKEQIKNDSNGERKDSFRNPFSQRGEQKQNEQMSPTEQIKNETNWGPYLLPPKEDQKQKEQFIIELNRGRLDSPPSFLTSKEEREQLINESNRGRLNSPPNLFSPEEGQQKQNEQMSPKEQMINESNRDRLDSSPKLKEDQKQKDHFKISFPVELKDSLRNLFAPKGGNQKQKEQIKNDSHGERKDSFRNLFSPRGGEQKQKDKLKNELNGERKDSFRNLFSPRGGQKKKKEQIKNESQEERKGSFFNLFSPREDQKQKEQIKIETKGGSIDSLLNLPTSRGEEKQNEQMSLPGEQMINESKRGRLDSPPKEYISLGTVLYNFKGESDKELNVSIGDSVSILKVIGDWSFCIVGNKKGYLPTSYIEIKN
jgi:hypothetical protein